MIPGATWHVLRDVRINEKSAAGLKVHVGIADIGFAFAQSFYFRAMQHQAGFQLLKDMVIVGSGAILRDNLFLGRFSVLGPLGFFDWLGHNLSFYLMTRLIERAAKSPSQPRRLVAIHQGIFPASSDGLANGTV